MNQFGIPWHSVWIRQCSSPKRDCLWGEIVWQPDTWLWESQSHRDNCHLVGTSYMPGTELGSFNHHLIGFSQKSHEERIRAFRFCWENCGPQRRGICVRPPSRSVAETHFYHTSLLSPFHPMSEQWWASPNLVWNMIHSVNHLPKREEIHRTVLGKSSLWKVPERWTKSNPIVKPV